MNAVRLKEESLFLEAIDQPPIAFLAVTAKPKRPLPSSKEIVMLSPRFSAIAPCSPRLRSVFHERLLVLALPLVLVAAMNRTAAATNGTWIDATSGGLWSAAVNWSGGTVANGTDGIADFSTLNITSDNTVHLDTARTIGQLKFGDTTPSNNWILDNNGVATNVLTLAVSSGSPTITVNNDTATINLVLAGTQGFAKSGAGQLLLNDADTFSGSVAINAGTLALGSSGALGSTSTAVSVIAGSTLDLGGQAIGANPLALVGTGVGGNGALINSSATPAVYAGNITLSGPSSVGGNGQTTLSGTVAGNSLNPLTKIGSNTVTLSGTTDNTGLGVVVNNGTVVLAKTSSGPPNLDVHAVGGTGLTVNGGIAQLGGTGGDQIYDQASVTVTSGAFDTNGQNETFATLNLQGTGIGGAGALVNSASGSLSVITPTGGINLTGNATIGVTQISSELQLNNAIGGGFALTKTGLGVLDLEGNNSFSGGLAVQQGFLQTFLPMNNASTNGVLGNNTSVTLGSSGQTGELAFAGNGGTSDMPFTLAAGGTGAFFVGTGESLQLSGTIGGAGALLLTGGGTFTLSGSNAFTGGATIDTGATLLIGNSGALNSVVPNVMTDNGTLNLNGKSVTVANLTGSGIVQNASGRAATLTVDVPGALKASFAGTIQDGTGAPLSLVKTGTGTLTIGAAVPAGQIITYTGTTTISGGTLHVQTVGFNPQSNGIGSAFTSATIVDNGVLEFDVTFIPPQFENDVAAYTGTISGSGSLTKSGGGTLLLAGNDTYTGTTTVTGGTLELLLGSLSSNVVNQATFEFDGGTFSGRLTNLGTAKFDADFIPGNGMENDGVATAVAGVNLTFHGAGLDNEGTLTASGTITLVGAANVNRGNLNVSNLNITGATLANNGSLVLAGGTINGTSGTLINGIGGSVSGTGVISTTFNNNGGLVTVGSGTLNIMQPFTNGGTIQLTSLTANLIGGAISNSGTIEGFGNIGNAVINTATGTVEALDGTLQIDSALTNPAGGMLTSGAGSKLLVTAGLATNAGIINLTGGTYDNGGHPLNNTGQISGFGIFRSGGTGLDNNGTITFSGGLTTVNGPVTNESGRTITVAQNNAIFTGLVTNNATATFNAVNAVATFAGGFVNNSNSNFVKAGGGSVEIDAAPTLDNGSALSVTTGTLRFNVVSGTPTIGTGVTAVVSAGAILELAGSVSALANGPNRADIANNSNAPGLLVSGTNQVVGNIDGSGTTQVNAGSDLTANHIIQSALVISGTSKNPGLVTIDTSDASGNPLTGPTVHVAPTSETPGSNLDDPLGYTTNCNPLADSPPLASSVTPVPAAVPEPSSLALLAIGGLAVACAAFRRRPRILVGQRPPLALLNTFVGRRKHPADSGRIPRIVAREFRRKDSAASGRLAANRQILGIREPDRRPTDSKRIG